MDKLETERCRRFIQDRKWTFAKSYPTLPHEYTVKTYDQDNEFMWFVKLIRQYGEVRSFFGRRNFTYLVFGDEQYWTMGAPIEETIIINRAAVRRKR